MRAIDVVIRELCLSIAEGKQSREASKGGEGAGDQPAGDTPRRSRRAQFRADDATKDAGENAASTSGASV
jgi:hypothetical protein